MTKSQLKELKLKAEKATPGPWSVYGTANQHVRTEALSSEFRVHKINCKIDAAFIAASNPQVILDLIERVEGLQGALEVCDVALVAAKRTMLDPGSNISGAEHMNENIASEALERFGVKDE